jgi:DNA polymerase delta subunit 1
MYADDDNDDDELVAAAYAEDDANDDPEEDDALQLLRLREEEEAEEERAPRPPAFRTHAWPLLERLRPRGSSSGGGPRCMMIMDVVARGADMLLLGRCDDGLSGCVRVSGWHAHLFVAAPHGYTAAQNSVLRELLETKLATHQMYTKPTNTTTSKLKKKTRGDGSQVMHAVTLVRGKSVHGYSPEAPAPFLKLEVVRPWALEALLAVWTGYTTDAGDQVPGLVLQVDARGQPSLYEARATETFHSNLDPVLQFMVDARLSGCDWVACTGPGLCRADPLDRCSHCAHEWQCECTTLVLERGRADLAPLRVLSFDLEAAGRRGVFPQASHDPVIQIAVYLHVVGGKDDDENDASLTPILLSLRECAPIEGAEVVSFEDEGALLRAFRDIAVAFDADVFTGFNILNFDFPYLHDRAAALSGKAPREFPWLSPELSDDTSGESVVTHFDNMSRVRGGGLRLRETEYQSAQTGKRKRTRVTLPGRVCLDMLIAIQNTHRLDSYSLKACAEHFLEAQNKVDLPFTQITPKWNEGPEGRRELGVYCLKDAELPLLLCAKVSALLGTVEMARATGVLFDAVLQRGVLVRNTSLLLRHAGPRGLLFPNLNPTRQKQKEEPSVGRTQRYEGATVLEPVTGLYGTPVGVLDFSAMYPSIIMAHNLCYSTYVLPDAAATRALMDEATRRLRNGETDDDGLGALRINGHVFVTPRRERGLLPEICKDLLECRQRAKAALKAAIDPMAKQVMDARQQAFKVAANGMYGALASPLSLLPLMQIAESVTALGRLDLLRVKAIAETMYPDCLVVYGDTDSVFVRFHEEEAPDALQTRTTAERVEAAAEKTLALAARINGELRAPKSIAFEKVLSVMLLLCKKRYAAIMYKAGFKWGTDRPETLLKGLQSVRRDGCALVRELVREVVDSILGTGDDTDAAALVRARLLDVVHDRVPLEAYAIRKTLRKSYADCCHPMTRGELRTIRSALRVEASEEPRLSFAEEEAALLRGVALPYRPRVRLPHVTLAWRLRRKDPGSAPVPGEAIEYVMACNGGGSACEKVEAVDEVRARHLPVDRAYYLKALRVPLDAIFGPIAAQRLLERVKDARERARAVEAELHLKLWRVLQGRRLEETPEAKRARIDHSPLARAFARAAAAAKPKD